MAEPTEAQLKKLWAVCKGFINKQDIICEEAVWQMDNVQIAAPELVEAVCKVVGYKGQRKAKKGAK